MIEIVPIKEFTKDAEFVADHMREKDVVEVLALSARGPHDSIRDSIAASRDAYVAKADGEPVAVFGAGWKALGLVAVPWLLGTDRVGELGLPLIRYSRAYMKHLRKGCSRLINVVHADNEPSIKYLKAIGFEFAPKQTLPNGAEIYVFSMEGDLNV